MTENLVLVPVQPPYTTTVIDGVTYVLMEPEVLRKALSHAVEAEPVAEPFGWWMSDNASEAYMTFERDEHTRRTRMNMRHGDWTETALYTHPSSTVTAEVAESFAADVARELFPSRWGEGTGLTRSALTAEVHAALLSALKGKE